jgi:hypothetical protein
LGQFGHGFGNRCAGETDELLRGAAGAAKARPLSLHLLVSRQRLQCAGEKASHGWILWNRDAVVHPLALTSSRDELPTPQISQMTGDCRLWKPKNFDEIADAHFLAAHEVQQPQAGAICEPLKYNFNIAGAIHLDRVAQYIRLCECIKRRGDPSLGQWRTQPCRSGGSSPLGSPDKSYRCTRTALSSSTFFAAPSLNFVRRAQLRDAAKSGSGIAAAEVAKYFRWKKNATLTSPIMTGTSTSGPITAANAAPELMPNTATATAIANSKLFEAVDSGKGARVV